MSEEGANLPEEVQGSHDQATAPNGSIPAGDGSPPTTVMSAGSNSSSASKLASAVNNLGSSEGASPAVLSAGEGINAASSKIASPAVLRAGEDNNAASSKIASPTVLIYLHDDEDNNNMPKIASPAVLLAGGEKGDNAAGSTLASPATMLHDCDDNKAMSHAAGVDNVVRSMLASPAVLHAGEDSNSASSKIASPAVLIYLHGDEDNNAVAKIASPVVLLAGGENGNDAAGSKLASPATMLPYCDDSKAGSHVAGVDNNAARSKLANPVAAMLHVGDGNNSTGSKLDVQIASPAVPQAIVDTTTGSKLENSAVLHAGEHNNGGFKVPKPVVLHASKDVDNHTGRPMFTNPLFLHAAEVNKAKTKLAIQAVSHACGNGAGSPRLTRSAAATLAAKDNTSELAIQVVPRPHHAGKDNNAGSSSKATRPAAVDAGKSNTKEGENSVAGEQHAHEAADVGSGSGKRKASAVEDADHDLHIFTERERRKKMKNMFSTLHGLLPMLPDKADKASIVGEAVIYIRALETTLHKLEKIKMERSRALEVGASSRRAAPTARHPGPSLASPALASSSSSREASLADMVHSLQVHQAAAAAAKQAMMTVAAIAAPAGSSSSVAAAAASQLSRGAVAFPAPAAGFQTWSGQNAVVSVVSNEAYISLRCPRDPGTLPKALFVLERHNIEVVTTTISSQDGLRMYGIHARATPASATARFPETLCAEDRFKLAVSEMLQMINL